MGESESNGKMLHKLAQLTEQDKVDLNEKLDLLLAEQNNDSADTEKELDGLAFDAVISEVGRLQMD